MLTTIEIKAFFSAYPTRVEGDICSRHQHVSRCAERALDAASLQKDSTPKLKNLVSILPLEMLQDRLVTCNGAFDLMCLIAHRTKLSIGLVFQMHQQARKTPMSEEEKALFIQVHKVKQGRQALEDSKVLLGNPEGLHAHFTHHAGAIQRWLQHELIAMLQTRPSAENRARFKETKQIMRRATRSLCFRSQERKLIKDIYLRGTWGQNLCYTQWRCFEDLAPEILYSKDTAESLLVYDLFLQFHRAYKLRYVMKDVPPAAMNMILHGTNALSLNPIERSGGYLFPSGILQRMGKQPVSGELREGSGEGGINYSNISVVAMEEQMTARAYAVRYRFNPQESLDECKRLCRNMERHANDPHILVSAFYTPLTAYVKHLSRVRSCLPVEYTELEPRLRSGMDIQRSRLKRMHDSGYTFSDYDMRKCRIFEASLRAIDQVINGPVQKMEIDEELVKIGIVFASSITPHSDSLFSIMSPEKIVGRPLALGRDINRAYLTESCPELKSRLEALGVKVGHVSELDEARAFEEKNVKILGDVAGAAKLRRTIVERTYLTALSTLATAVFKVYRAAIYFSPMLPFNRLRQALFL